MQWQLIAAALALPACLAAQAPACACGAQPPGPPASHTAIPYANTPDDLRPFANYTEPYYQHYTKTPEYNGAAAEARTVPAAEVNEVPIGFLGPIQDHKDSALGLAMLQGAHWLSTKPTRAAPMAASRSG
jgi:hypothetical protein